MFCQTTKLRESLLSQGLGVCSYPELLREAGVPFTLHLTTYGRNIWKNCQEYQPQAWLQRDCAEAITMLQNLVLLDRRSRDVPPALVVGATRIIGADAEQARSFLAAMTLGAPLRSTLRGLVTEAAP
jgi:hypothetical protein